ncbi:MAG: ACT domain-containing protein [Hespellia sp.]|nr:ACT domain-containing protein [Hespellia sp.]
MRRCIVTVLGQDTVGIIAKVCSYLADNKINILDISQTIVQGYFNMMMIVDVSALEKDFGEVVEELDNLGMGIGVKIRCQREEIFEKMHRL